MDIEKLLPYAKKPTLYDAGTSVMWTDPHISRQLLKFHIDPDNDVASRSDRKIEALVDWIVSKAPNDKMEILDLGCGPGLYAEKFARRGHSVVGIDFSEAAIEYARERTRSEGSGIEYAARITWISTMKADSTSSSSSTWIFAC